MCRNAPMTIGRRPHLDRDARHALRRSAHRCTPGVRGYLVSALAAVVLAACASSTTAAGAGQREAPRNAPVAGGAPLIVVGFDGFRRSYLDTDSTPVLHDVARTGVIAEAMIPSFPSVTFPNFYTLATGLYPEHSGIVANDFYDSVFHASFSMRNAAIHEARWWNGEPIWVTAVKHGERSATMFWVGSEAPVAGHYPTYWKPYDGSVPFGARVQQVMQWLDLPPDRRPQLIMVYFSEPDASGHRYGPDAPQTAAAVARVDSVLGELVDGLRARDLYDRVNLIIVADHGMSAVSPDRVVYLDDVVDSASVRVVTLTPVLMIEARDGNNEALLARLQRLPHVTVWRKADVPARLHYNEGRRIAPIVGVADDGWMIAWRHGHALTERGAHGYDNADASMRALFVAHGPAFRPGATVAAFPNVDVYSLMAHLLDVLPAPNDGSLAPFDSVLVVAASR